jgi:Ricin-type beta-trefoil lectin domain
VLAAVAAVMICGVLTAGQASASPVTPQSHAQPAQLNGGGFFQPWNVRTGLCLDDSDQYGLRTYPCYQYSYDNGYQKWIDLRTGASQLYNVATGKCLDDSDQYGLRTYPCYDYSYDNGYQKWIVTISGASGVQLENWATGRCLDDSEQYGLRTYPCYWYSYDNGYQKWGW